MAVTTSAFNLLVYAGQVSRANAAVPIALHGTGGSGINAGLPLYLQNIASENVASGSLPLHATGSGVYFYGEGLNLYAAGLYYRTDSGIDLWVQQSGLAASLNMWASGEGYNPGATPLSASMPLYLQRDFGSVMPIFVQSQGYPVDEEMNLFARGAILVEESMNLVLPSSVGLQTDILNLSAHGW